MMGRGPEKGRWPGRHGGAPASEAGHRAWKRSWVSAGGAPATAALVNGRGWTQSPEEWEVTR